VPCGSSSMSIRNLLIVNDARFADPLAFCIFPATGCGAVTQIGRLSGQSSTLLKYSARNKTTHRGPWTNIPVPFWNFLFDFPIFFQGYFATPESRVTPCVCQNLTACQLVALACVERWIQSSGQMFFDQHDEARMAHNSPVNLRVFKNFRCFSLQPDAIMGINIK